MNINTKVEGKTAIAVVDSEGPVITDVQSALDLMMSVRFETGCDRIVISKEAVSEEFFRLSSGMAGEILQKFVNYQMKLAVYGDFSQYTSKPLKDFIYESNKGKDFCFMETQKAAEDHLMMVD